MGILRNLSEQIERMGDNIVESTLSGRRIEATSLLHKRFFMSSLRTQNASSNYRARIIGRQIFEA